MFYILNKALGKRRGHSFFSTIFSSPRHVPCALLLYVERFRLFHLRNKTWSSCLHNLVKTEAKVWENSRGVQWKPETQSRVFTCSRILTNFTRWGFHQAMKAQITCFTSFIKLLFFVLTKRKTTYEAHIIIFYLASFITLKKPEWAKRLH